MSRKTIVAAAVGIAAAATLAAGPADAAAPHRPCAEEYTPLAGSGCVWDGRHMGDRVGRSYFVDASGYVVYLPHRKAHRLLGR